MALALSKVTSQGQVSIPAEIRRRLGIEPGSVIEWDEDGSKIVVRRAGKYTFEDIHKKLFPDGPPAYRTDGELKEGIAEFIREKHVRP